MREEILRIENVIRIINGITYLDNIQLHVFQGEILGLIPLDNHGREELVELIVQNVPIHFGRVYFAGELVNYYEHSSLARNPVYVIEKESKLVGDLKVADNIAVLSSTYRRFIIRERALLAETNQIFQDLGIAIDIDRYASELSFFETAVVELIRAVLNGAQLIITDDLASLLNADELTAFQRLIKHYAHKGISFLYIASNPTELYQVCERLVLFEKGRIRRIVRQNDFSPELLSPYRLPHAPPQQPGNAEHSSAPGIFRCQNLTTANLSGLSFSVQPGQCLTILNPAKRGIQDLADIITGALKPTGGNLVVAGRPVPITGQSLLPWEIAYIPEDPVPKCLFFDYSYMENLTFLLDRKLRRSIIKPQILRFVREEFRPLAGDAIDAPDLWSLEMNALYSLVYFRVLLYKPKVAFIMQPFAHADMHLSVHIVQLINILKQNDLAVVLLTASLADAGAVTDRLIVLNGEKFTEVSPQFNDHTSKTINPPEN
ncbi:MAG: ATP-binding cassette domain-containing protein [Limnochordia bacterium]|jgi:ribose transport system ATP-binding protein